jgi:hypothetical protein
MPGEGHRKGTDVSVGRTYRHANRDVLVEGDPLPVRAGVTSSRRFLGSSPPPHPGLSLTRSQRQGVMAERQP